MSRTVNYETYAEGKIEDITFMDHDHTVSWKTRVAQGVEGYSMLKFSRHNGIGSISIKASEGYAKSHKEVLISLTPDEVLRLRDFLNSAPYHIDS